MTDAWDWSEAKRRGRVVVEEPLRPKEMLAAHGMDRRHLCGDCRHYQHGSHRSADRCALSLRGSPRSIGYIWRRDWYACGAWQSRAVADGPETAEPGDQLRLL
jgi:hypothetical protein